MPAIAINDAAETVATRRDVRRVMETPFFEDRFGKSGDLLVGSYST